MEVRKWHLSEATASVRRLRAVLPELNEAEVRRALKLESESCRRSVMLRLLIDKAVRLNAQKLTSQLKEQYNYGTSR